MKKGKKTDLWRIIAAVISGLYIIYLWSSNDIEAAAGSETWFPSSSPAFWCPQPSWRWLPQLCCSSNGS